MDLDLGKAEELLRSSQESGIALEEEVAASDPRPPNSIPKRKKRRRIPRPYRPKHLQIPRKQGDFQHRNRYAIQERQSRVWTMRVDEGKSYGQIAGELGISEGTVKKDLRLVSELRYKDILEKDELVLLESNTRYDQMMSRWLPLVMNADVVVEERKTKPDGEEIVIRLSEWDKLAKGTEMMLKILRQREQLNGFHDTRQGSGRHNDLTPEQITEGMSNLIKAFQSPRQLQPRTIEATIINDNVSTTENKK